MISQLCHIAYGGPDSKYDMANMVEYVQFLTIVTKIRMRAESTLSKEYQRARGPLLKKIEQLKEGMECWTASAQLQEYGVKVRTEDKKKKIIPHSQARRNAQEKRDKCIKERKLRKKTVETHIGDNRQRHRMGLAKAVELFAVQGDLATAEPVTMTTDQESMAAEELE